jgi:hypothetical protein
MVANKSFDEPVMSELLKIRARLCKTKFEPISHGILSQKSAGHHFSVPQVKRGLLTSAVFKKRRWNQWQGSCENFRGIFFSHAL